MANPNGRPKVHATEKAKTLTLSFKPFYIDHIKKSGGSKYIVRLIDRDIAGESSQIPPPARPGSCLVEKLRKMSKKEGEE